MTEDESVSDDDTMPNLASLRLSIDDDRPDAPVRIDIYHISGNGFTLWMSPDEGVAFGMRLMNKSNEARRQSEGRY